MIWLSSREVAAVLLLWLITASSSLAQHSALEVRSPSATLLETSPGHIVTASVVVANRGPETEEYTERLTLPPGCQKVAPADVPFRLAVGAQAVRVLAVNVPATMPAGRFDLRYVVQGRRDPSIGSIDLSIDVLPVDKLELTVDPRTDPVLAGDNYPIHVRVTNHGNRPLPVRLKWRSSLGYQITGSKSDLVLPGGSTQEILVRVESDKRLEKKASHAVTFEATATAANGEVLNESQASVVELIPLVSGNRDPFHRFPMQLKLTELFERDHDAQFQAEFSGAGTLDEAGHQRVDFLFRGPDIQDASLFGERDEYGVSYHDDHWDVNLGDRIYELSPLTERHAFGRGAGLNWHDGPTTVGAFYLTTRHRQKNAQEIGAFVREELGGGFSAQGSFLRKWGEEFQSSLGLPQNIYSLETRYRHGKELDLRTEYGVSQSDSGTTDYGVRVEAKGELFRKVRYTVEHVRAGPDFHGYDNDTKTTYATVEVPVTKRFRVHATLNEYSGNLDLNSDRSSVVNRENSWSAGSAYTLTKKTEVALDWQHSQRKDILMPAAYDFTEDYARASLSHNFGKLQMLSFLDLGTLDNSLTAEQRAFQRYNVFLNWQPTARQNYSLYGTYGPSAFNGTTDNSLTAGASAAWKIKDNLSTSLSYARAQFDSLNGREQDQAMATARYRFSSRDEISLIGRWTRTTERERDEAAVMVTFTHPFDVAVSRKRSIGTVHGRVYNSAIGRSGGLPRVVVMAGEAYAVTDEVGEFDFPSLKPGTCELRIIADSLGPKMAVTTPMPMKVKVRSGETTNVNIETVPAASVAVHVRLYEFADGNSVKTSGALREAGGLEAATIELGNGRDFWRTQTDRLGNASFDRLPAGRWNLRVIGDVPALHTLENPERGLDLKPGETEDAEVRVLPRRRVLRMIDEGAVR